MQLSPRIGRWIALQPDGPQEIKGAFFDANGYIDSCALRRLVEQSRELLVVQIVVGNHNADYGLVIAEAVQGGDQSLDVAARAFDQTERRCRRTVVERNEQGAACQGGVEFA